MVRNETDMQAECVLSLGLMLTTIYNLSRRHYGNQSVFYAQFFAHYHKMMSGRELIEWQTSQSTVSAIMRSMHDLPDDQYRYYSDIDGDKYLRIDVQRYISMTVRTCRQRVDLYNQLLSLVERSSNLDPGDRQYILDHSNVDENIRLEELMYRMLYILIREPNEIAQ